MNNLVVKYRKVEPFIEIRKGSPKLHKLPHPAGLFLTRMDK